MKKALVVGINNYPSSPLSGCINDASDVATILETHGDGSPNFDVRLETDVQTKSNLKAMIVELFSGNSDTVLLYFSGHGFLNEIGGYLVTPDHAKYDEGMSMDEILVLANQSKSKDKIIIIDCCHSGALGTPTIGGGASQLQEGVTILTASRDDESSIEINGHISPGGIYAYIDQALGAWEQRPVFKTNVTRFTSLRTVTPQVSLDTLRKIIEYFPAPQNEFKLDPSYEDTNAKDVKHVVIEPYAKPDNVAVFKNLQKFQSVGLVVPVNTEYMYFAAMESKSCRLTSLGYHYWRLVKDRRI